MKPRRVVEIAHLWITFVKLHCCHNVTSFICQSPGKQSPENILVNHLMMYVTEDIDEFTCNVESIASL